MSQTYCRPVEGAVVLLVRDSRMGGIITVSTRTGRYVIGAGIMVHLRGEEVVREWCGEGGVRHSEDMVSGIRNDEFLIDEEGSVHKAADVRGRR